MEALICRKLGDPTEPMSDSSAIFVSISHPPPLIRSPTDIRIRVIAASLNYANYLQILGKYQEKHPLPFIPGSDFSGVVESVGIGVRKFKIGDRVCASADFGAYAEMVVMDEKQLFRVPDGCDMVAAGGLPVAFGTSHVALVHRAQLKPGQVLLVLGAAGGVGISAVQIGKVCGAIVIAAARGIEKVNVLKSLGADHVVNLSEEGLSESVKEYLKSRGLKGVDVLYDPVGGKLMKESMKLLNWGAKILVIGFASGDIPVIPANIALVKNWTIHGLYWGSYWKHCPSVLKDSLNELLSWLQKGLISVNVSHRYSLSQANLAFNAIKERMAIGKVMLVLSGTPQSQQAKL
ncbi:groES-like zinc-binding alcohol dehydrogenase family protein [Wolffia australiana]